MAAQAPPAGKSTASKELTSLAKCDCRPFDRSHGPAIQTFVTFQVRKS